VNSLGCTREAVRLRNIAPESLRGLSRALKQSEVPRGTGQSDHLAFALLSPRKRGNEK
jgi:hypothetical protein